jgi:uncharacterized membrane protein YdjX (TVP38/TMEM64 family)
MRQKLKRVAVLLVAGFFAFAPPGTLLLAAALLFGLLGRVWLGVAALCLTVFAALWLYLKLRKTQRAGQKNS